MSSSEAEARGYVRSIERVTEDIRNFTRMIAELRAERKRAQLRLCQWMERRDLKVFEGIKINTLIQKPPPIKRKPKKQLKHDVLTLFRDVGIPDPEEFYREYQKIQYRDDESRLD